ncbi:MAG: ABC transporter permease [Anaerolineales bacterium]
MRQFLLRRFVTMIFTVFIISILAFIIIQLPPGDYVDQLITRMTSQGGQSPDPATVQKLKDLYGLNDPVPIQYIKWIGKIILRGEFGYSFTFREDAIKIISERLPATFLLSLSSFMFVWIVSLPIGIYSAVKKYSIGDYIISGIGFVGLAVPSFLLALVCLYISYKYFGVAAIGLYSKEFANAPWSWARVADLLQRVWIPMVVIGIGGTAGLIRTLRANLLDELNKPYVDTARAKGLSEARLLWKYPVRHALNPFVSTLGWMLPGLISGEVIVAIVLNLPTSGPVLYNALAQQDMYVAAGFLLLLSVLTVIGTFVSDILLALLDPRIRLQ